MTTLETYTKIRAEIAARILGGSVRHFLDFHFGNDTRFARDFVKFMCQLESLSPGAGYDIIKRIGGLQGEAPGTYEQIVQILCELVIAKKFIDSYPADHGYVFKWEPKDKNKSNPEFLILSKDWRLLVEVKAPALIDYDVKNRGVSMQLPSRLPGMRDWMTSMSDAEPALPLDNKVKDFLISAEKKFSSFGEIDVPTYGLLVICWGQRMFEGIGPLSNEGCGLLKPTSFYEANGEKVRFPNVSGVVVTQHQFFVQEMLAQRYQFPTESCLDYGDYWVNGSPPNPVFSENVYANRQLLDEFKDVLQTVAAGESLDPMGNIVDTVFWINTARPSANQEKRVKIGRNEACTCGSGKKYKRCCG